MELLRSSIVGREFVNYRKATIKEERVQFSHRVRVQGLGNIPIVVDSVDKELTEALSDASQRGFRYRTYGKEMVVQMDQTIGDILKEVKVYLVQRDKEDVFKESSLVLGLEDGTLPSIDTKVGALYKKT